MRQLTNLEKKWLYSRGGRNESHCHLDPDSKVFIYMGLARGGNEKVYIPEEDELKKMFKVK